MLEKTSGAIFFIIIFIKFLIDNVVLVSAIQQHESVIILYIYMYIYIYTHTYIYLLAVSLVAQLVRNLPAMWETCVWSLGWEDPLEKGKATHSSILAWRIPRTV